MKKIYHLLMLLLLINIGITLTASSQDQVSQTVYVYDGDFNGTLLSDVQVIGVDAGGNGFEGITDSNGAVVIYGEPGTWKFTFLKEGYDDLNLNYDVTKAGEGAVYLQRAMQPEDQVSQTVYVYDGDFNGTLLSDVQVIGVDAGGNSFEGITDSNGAVVIYGEPGTWKFTFLKEDYNPLNLDYDITKTGEGAVYLQKITVSQDQPEADQVYQQSSFEPLFEPIPPQTADYTA